MYEDHNGTLKYYFLFGMKENLNSSYPVDTLDTLHTKLVNEYLIKHSNVTKVCTSKITPNYFNSTEQNSDDDLGDKIKNKKIKQTWKTRQKNLVTLTLPKDDSKIITDTKENLEERIGNLTPRGTYLFDALTNADLVLVEIQSLTKKGINDFLNSVNLSPCYIAEDDDDPDVDFTNLNEYVYHETAKSILSKLKNL